jgi:hypothetical protein
MLQYVNSAIDAIQNTKRRLINTFVKDEPLKSSSHSYVDAQTAFVKQTAKTANDNASRITKFDFTELNKVWK